MISSNKFNSFITNPQDDLPRLTRTFLLAISRRITIFNLDMLCALIRVSNLPPKKQFSPSVILSESSSHIRPVRPSILPLVGRSSKEGGPILSCYFDENDGKDVPDESMRFQGSFPAPASHKLFPAD